MVKKEWGSSTAAYESTSGQESSIGKRQKQETVVSEQRTTVKNHQAPWKGDEKRQRPCQETDRKGKPWYPPAHSTVMRAHKIGNRPKV